MNNAPLLCHIAVIDENFVIGKEGKLVYDLPDDMKWFLQKTRGNVIIMGRKTLAALPKGEPLPDRSHIVISHDAPDFEHPLLVWKNTIEDALTLGRQMAAEKNQKEVFIIGGGEIYAATIDMSDRLYLTLVEAKGKGDAFYPQFDKSEWSKIIVSDIGKDDETPGFKICQFDRIKPLQ